MTVSMTTVSMITAQPTYSFGRKLERWPEYRGLQIMSKRPTYHGCDHGLANCLLIVADQLGLDLDI